MQIQFNGTASVTTAGEYNVANYGDVFDGADISDALALALEAAFQNGNSRVSCPPGRYILGDLVDVAFPNVGGAANLVSVDFPGVVLELPDTNTAGGVKITKQNNLQRLHVRNLEVQSAMPIGAANGPTNGRALEFYSNLRPGDAGWGTTEACELFLDNVRVTSKAPASMGRFSDGIRVDGFWFPEFRNTWVNTRHPGTDGGTGYESGDGIAIWNCYSPIMSNCYSLGRFTHNIRIDEDEDFGYEDFQITGCYGVGGKDALAVRMSSSAMQAASQKEPGGRISGGHFNGHRRAISIENRRQFAIDGAQLYLTIGDNNYNYPGAAFLFLHNCQDGTINGVRVPEGGHYVNDSDCTRHIHLSGTTDHTFIDSCRLAARGIAIANTATGLSNTVGRNVFGSTSGAPDKQIVDPHNRLVIQN